MATPLTIEEESGTITRTRHPHQGYHAGDFSNVPFHELHLAPAKPNRLFPPLASPQQPPIQLVHTTQADTAEAA